MTVNKISFGKNLRPTTVEAVNKINELVGALNAIDTSEIAGIKTDVDNLKTKLTTAEGSIKTLQTDLDSAEATITAHTSDIDKVKVTLYTPLASGEDVE